MLQSYFSVSKTAQVEFEERKSRFLASCGPVETETEAWQFIQAARDAWPDASHHVYAWLLGRDIHLQRYSDAGEPQGTAGLPVMQVLQKNNLIQAAVVVTRYYGGTQLGAGGLVRAYSTSAAMAVQAAGLICYRRCQQYKVTVGYTDLDRMQRFCVQAGYPHEVVGYGLDAEICLSVPLEQSGSIEADCLNLTAGAALVEPSGQVYLPLPLPDPPDLIGDRAKEKSS